MPTNAPGLKAVFSYYQSTSKLTAEGDVVISDEALQGLGTILDFLKTSLFGAIIQLVKPSQVHTGGQNPEPIAMGDDKDAKPQLFIVDELEESTEDDPYIPIKPARRKELEGQELVALKPKRQPKLTDFIPDVGYFVAGGVSGITSRTATAPLDRLKVYLIAQTGNAEDTVQAVKSGKAVSAAQHGARTLWNACKELWAAGGMRSLFAGNGINVVKVMPESSVKFGAYEVRPIFSRSRFHTWPLESCITICSSKSGAWSFGASHGHDMTLAVARMCASYKRAVTRKMRLGKLELLCSTAVSRFALC